MISFPSTPPSFIYKESHSRWRPIYEPSHGQCLFSSIFFSPTMKNQPTHGERCTPSFAQGHKAALGIVLMKHRRGPIHKEPHSRWRFMINPAKASVCSRQVSLNPKMKNPPTPWRAAHTSVRLNHKAAHVWQLFSSTPRGPDPKDVALAMGQSIAKPTIARDHRPYSHQVHSVREW